MTLTSHSNPLLVLLRNSHRTAAEFIWLMGSPASTEVRYGAEVSHHARRVICRLIAFQTNRLQGD